MSGARRASGGANSRRRRRGATAVDYLFCLSLIIVVCIGAVRFVGGMLNESVAHSADQIKQAGSK